MKKAYAKIMVGITLGLILLPVFAFAQSSAPILTQQELKDMTATQSALDKTSATYVSDREAAMRQCAALGDKLYTATNQKYSSGWSLGDDKCYFGIVLSKSDALGIWKQVTNRAYHVEPIPDSAIEPLISNGEFGKTEITTESIQKVESDRNSGSSFDWIFQFLVWVFKGVANIFASILAGLAAVAMKLLHFIIMSTTNKNAPQIIYTTWVVVRDFMNLVFIFALIVMALATILRREEYNYKQLLFKLIVMAILINFSYIIAKTLVDFSDSLIRMMAPQAGFPEYLKLLFKGYVTGGDVTFANFFGQGESILQGVGDSVTKLVSLVILIVAIFTIALMMFVRLIGLWFLIMISPAAYALNILPSTKKYAKQWWDTFIKYLIWGPVAMFFFRVSFVLLNQAGGNLVNEPILNNLFVAAFVWAGVIVAKQAGMIGGSTITSYADKFAKGGAKFAATGYGNLFWRGTVPGGMAAPALWGAGKIGLAENRSLKEAYEYGKEKVGRGTAAVSNWPKIQKEKWIDRPNKDRTKLVERQYREMQLKRDYLKGFDKDVAAKIGDKDIDYMVKNNLLTEEKIRDILEHGTRDAKAKILSALHKGDIRAKRNDKDTGGLDHRAFEMIVGTIAESEWKKNGGDTKYMPDKFLIKTEVIDGKDVPVIDKNMFDLKAKRSLKDGESLEKLKDKDVSLTVKRDVVKRMNEIERERAKREAQNNQNNPPPNTPPNQDNQQNGNQQAA